MMYGCPYTPPAVVTGYRKVNGQCSATDIDSHDVSEEQCGELCDGNSECAGFTYIFSGSADDKCHLKQYMCGPPNTRRPDITTLDQWISYYKIWPDVTGYVRVEGDCSTTNIWRYSKTVQECATACSENEECKGFVYGSGSIILRCYLKRAMCSSPDTRHHTWTSYYKVDGAWVNWGEYGDCSVSCGGGTKKRTRICTTSSGGSSESGESGVCPGSDEEKTACNQGACPQMGPADVTGYRKLSGDCTTWNLATHDVSEARCGELCSDNSDCTGFAYKSSGSGNCRLKKRMCSLPAVNSQWTMYYKIWPDVEGYKKEFGECSAPNIRLYQSRTVEQCAALCSQNDDCKGFGYNAGE